MDSDTWLLVASTLGGIGFGLGAASVAYLSIFTKSLKELHDDNLETARLLIHGDARTAELLVQSDGNRAAEVSTTAEILADADEKITRKVTDGGK